MSEILNYEIAKKTADLIDDKIIEVLKSGKSFRVEAGAGSGKIRMECKNKTWH